MQAMPMTILIVDDNAEVRRVIRSVVADLAHDIRESTSCVEALEAFGWHRPDWVLMDIKMNGLDGLICTRVITAGWPQTRICIVTNYDDPELRAAATRAGACAYVVKENLIPLRTILGGSAERAITP
jgi:CheY-like chemotaxis protein